MPCRVVEQRLVRQIRVEEEEEIQYVHVIILYPYICKYAKFPVGHPEVYVGADCPPDCVDREGIIKC
jgi:hypothetical protein